MLEDEADMRCDRIVAQDGVARLAKIAKAEKDEGAEHGKRQQDLGKREGVN
jgi:hypothetical protein